MLKHDTAELSLVPSSSSRVVEERDRMRQWLAQRIALGDFKPITEIVSLTPVLADLLMETNAGNRTVSQTNLERIKRDVAGGLFEFNGESIIVSRDGKLNNGQHRCLAVIESGHAIRVVLVFGVERETRMTLDQGVTRTIGHFISMQGIDNANVMGAAAGFAIQYERGFPLATARRWRATKSEILRFLHDHPDMQDSVAFVMGKQSKGGLASKSVLAFCHYAITHRLPKSDRQAADLFMDALMSGDGLRKRDAILYVRNRLIDIRQGGSRQTNIRAQLIFSAWNHYRRSEKVDRIWTDDTRPLPDLEA